MCVCVCAWFILKCESGRSVSECMRIGGPCCLSTSQCVYVCVCCGCLEGEMLVVYKESQLSDTTLIFSLPALSLSLPALSVSPSIFVSPLLSEIQPPPASHYLKKCVYSSLLYSISHFQFLLLLFICYSVSLTHPLSGSWFEYLSCCKSKSIHLNLAPLHF